LYKALQSYNNGTYCHQQWSSRLLNFGGRWYVLWYTTINTHVASIQTSVSPLSTLVACPFSGAH
jgi:hypothetical protein